MIEYTQDMLFEILNTIKREISTVGTLQDFNGRYVGPIHFCDIGNFFSVMINNATKSGIILI